MRDSGRIAAAIDVLGDFERRRVPLKTALADWARNARYAGAKDRAWISGLCLDVLRCRRSLAAMMDDESPRAAVLAALRFLWGRAAVDVASLAAEEPHGPGALSEDERRLLSSPSPPSWGERVGVRGAPEGTDTGASSSGASRHLLPLSGEKEDRLSVVGDFPEWLEASVERAFGEDALAEMTAFATRADVDLRINTLKAEPEKALPALKSVGAVAHPFLKTAARIPAPDASERAPAVTVIPAFNKGWVEVQDLGSQISALAAGDIKGKQVLDFCAGGGGKTLALAAPMGNTGQLYAYDDDAHRLAPLYERARRAGVRNLQIVNPATDKAALAPLAGKMDVVFIDAPCTGCGVWRRHPDSKWRLTPEQLQRRIAEQDAVLRDSSKFVKPGGRLVYVTCSFLVEENEDRLDTFLRDYPEFVRMRALEAIDAAGLVTSEGRTALEKCETKNGDLRLTPARVGSDGFFIAALRRADGA